MVDLAGDAFRHELGQSRVPPRGYAFPNRFLHAPPGEWLEDLEEHDRHLDRSVIDQSLEQLISKLEKMSRVGASLPEHWAFEQAITVNLALLTIALAKEAVAVHRQLADTEPADTPLWDGDDANVDLIAEELRYFCRFADLVCKGSAMDTRPDLVVQFVVSGLTAGQVTLDKAGSLNSLNDLTADPTEANMMSMLRTKQAHDEFLASQSP